MAAMNYRPIRRGCEDTATRSWLLFMGGGSHAWPFEAPVAQQSPGPAHRGETLVRRARAGRVPGIFCDPCPTGGLLPLICWATLYGFAPWPPGHRQMF